MQENSALVSVIIPCFNHGHYLTDAIMSIQKQSYPNIEVIVVDDGSIDNTKEVALEFDEVKYIYQKNQGLSAARNTGVINSAGKYLVFLDADDLLYENAVSYNIKYLTENPSAAFVSGGYQSITFDKKNIDEGRSIVSEDHYINMLKLNYIGMHGTVMYQRWVFDEYLYDTSLRACEDHDLYLRISKKYPVLHHNKKIAAYRMHSENMSGNIPLMLSQAVEILEKQKPYLVTDLEKDAYREGIQGYKDYYINQIYGGLRTNKLIPTKELLGLLKENNPKSYLIYIIAEMIGKKLRVKKLIPNFVFRAFQQIGLYKNYIPMEGKVRFGDLNRNMPISTAFGYDRGGRIDRYYIENFLQKESESIKGKVLEIGDNEYTLRFGGSRIGKSEILHVNDSNPNATIIGDLSNAPQIADNTFDCIILTQTLHLVYDYKSVINTCYRILRPGGVLLLTVPGITPIDYGEWEKNWLWSFTGLAIEKIMNETFPITHLEIQTFGNVYAATSFLYGLGLPEVKKAALDFHDPHFQVIITAKATKPF